MSGVSHPASRRRRWWVALLLNTFLPPVGYAYLGRWKTVLALLGGATLAVIGLFEWSLARPPGFYGAIPSQLLLIGWTVTVLLGVHAAWLARKSPPKQGSRLVHALSYVGVMLAFIGVSLLLRAFWPHSVYTTASEAMLPSLIEGDVVAVNGAHGFCGGATPKPGDVIVFRRGISPVRYMHRVVAGPGQTLSMAAGRLSIDGKPVAVRQLGTVIYGRNGFAARATIYRETLLNGATYLTYDMGPAGDLDNLAPTTVPAGAWYELGDNRDDAADSRVHGPVKASDVCGIATRIVFSKEKARVGAKP